MKYLPDHMTEDQLRAWGVKELAHRERELGIDKSHALARAFSRRRVDNLTAGQAAWAVGEAQKARRAKELAEVRS